MSENHNSNSNRTDDGSLETELIDRDRAIYRIDGRLWYDPDGFLDGSADIYD